MTATRRRPRRWRRRAGPRAGGAGLAQRPAPRLRLVPGGGVRRNDGLVSNFSLVLGMAGAGSSPRVVLGLAGRPALGVAVQWPPASTCRSAPSASSGAASQELDGPTLRALAEQEPRSWGWSSGQGVPAGQASSGGRAAQPGDGGRGRGHRRPGDRHRTCRLGVGGGPGSASCPSPPGPPSDPALPVHSRHPGDRGRRHRWGRRCSPPGRQSGVLAAGRWRAGPAPARIGAVAALVTYGLGRLFNTVVG